MSECVVLSEKIQICHAPHIRNLSPSHCVKTKGDPYHSEARFRIVPTETLLAEITLSPIMCFVFCACEGTRSDGDLAVCHLAISGVAVTCS